MYLYAKDPYKAKYQYLINNCEKVGLNHYDDPKLFIEYSNYMQEVSKILKNTIKEKYVKYWWFLMVWLLIWLIIKT